MTHEPRILMPSYGKTSVINIQGQQCKCASHAERRWLIHIEPLLVIEEMNKLVWQPPGFKLIYRYDGQECADVYRPDAIVTWHDGKEEIIEIKHSDLRQGSASKMKRFCRQYPDKKLVLVWFGSWPSKGKVRRRLDRLTPHLDRVWRMK